MLHAVLPTDRQNTLKYHLITVKPSFTVITVNCMHQTRPTRRKLEKSGMSPTCSTFIISVTVLVTVSKMGVVLYQAWSENQETIRLVYLAISTNVRH